MPFAIASRGEWIVALAVEQDRAGSRRLDAEERQRDIGASGADQPGEAQDLAAPQVEAHVFEDALAAEPSTERTTLARLGRRARLKQADLAADHVSDRALRRHLARVGASKSAGRRGTP